MKKIIFLIVVLLVIFLTGCGGGKTNCCPASVYTTDDAIARELLGWPSGWEEACEQVRAQNNLYGGRFYVRGLCFAPEADYPERYYTGGSGFFGPTCEQCVQGGEEAGERRIWVPCDDKTVPCRPRVKVPDREFELPSTDEHFCPPLTTDYDCPWYDEFLGTCRTPYDCCYRVPDWRMSPYDEEGRLYLWRCCYEQPNRPPGNRGCGSETPERCNWPPPWFAGGMDEFYRVHNTVPDPFCDTLRERAARDRPRLRDED